MLELNKLTERVAEMADTLARQRTRLESLTLQAEARLAAYAAVNDELRAKLTRAGEVDSSWRGAEPLGDRLDAVRTLPDPGPATLIASDGSQIYPDPHGVALYYLLNVGSIVLRQGSGAAPSTATRSRLFFNDNDLYDREERLIETDKVNAERDLWELQKLAELALAERQQLGGDLDRLLVALDDGPLLLWMPQRLTDVQQERRVEEFSRPLRELRQVQAVPLGYIDRPRSANILRLLQLADLALEEITTQVLRSNRYRGLSDRLLFNRLLGPGQRSSLFAATSEINQTYAKEGNRICFCYLNVAAPDATQPRVVRVEVPDWAARDEDRLDTALAAVWQDARLTGYPYVLARAHELAVVSRHERAALEQMMQIEMMRQGLTGDISAKQQNKNDVSGRR
ncbi:MAG: DNA double-strand break repair nuclease NurA [Anaerolineae bacterium]